MFTFRKILFDSLKITWQNWRFWFFGLLAVFFGATIEADLFNVLLSRDGNWFFDLTSLKLIFSSSFWANAAAAANANPGISIKIILSLLAILLIIAILIVAGVFGQIALVDKTDYLEKSAKFKDDSRRGFKALLTGRVAELKALSIVSLIFKMAIYILLSAVALPVMLSQGGRSLIVDLAYILLFVALVAATIVISMIFKLMFADMVINRYDWPRGLRTAWRLFTKNWLTVIEMSLMLFFMTVVGSFFIILLILAVFIPAVLLVALLAKVVAPLSFLVYIFFILFALIAFVVGGSIISTFNVVAWTKFYLKLNQDKLKSKILRVFNKA